MQLNLLLVTVMIVLSGYAAHADEEIQDKAHLETNELREKFNALPKILSKHLLKPRHKEFYIFNIMRYMRSSGVNGEKFTTDGLKNKQEMALYHVKKRQIEKVLMFDLNLDSNVTKEEVRGMFTANPPYYTRYKIQKLLDKKIMKEIISLDKDNNTNITYAEMGILSEEIKVKTLKDVAQRIQPYLDIDPNKDGILTANELEVLAIEAFNTFDTNKDGTISEEENKAYTGIVVQKQNAPKDTVHPE